MDLRKYTQYLSSELYPLLKDIESISGLEVTKLPPKSLIKDNSRFFLTENGNKIEYIKLNGEYYPLNGTAVNGLQLQKSATHIQWKNVTDTEWTDLIALSEITGPAGSNGVPGQNSLFSENILFVSSTTTNPNEYHTIAEAIAVWTTGKVILLAPEMFTEDVTLASANMIIKGMSREGTIINGDVTITGKDCIIENLTWTGDFINDCTEVWSWVYRTLVKKCIVLGDIYFGKNAILSYQIRFENCWINRDGEYSQATTKKIYINSSGTGNIEFKNCDIVNPMNIEFIRGRVAFYYCPLIEFNLITFANSGYRCEIDYNHSFCYFINQLVNNKTSEYAIIVFRRSRIIYDNDLIDTWTLNNLFEFDMFHCEWRMVNFIFNSVASSRLCYVQEIGYGNAHTISGTGLSYLRCQKNTFGCAAPIGLAENSSDWGMFLDA